jgi:hypothetical protein
MREYFKGLIKDKLYRFAKENGADYIEENKAIWKIPKQYGTIKIAVCLDNEGEIYLGTINPNCDNFELGTNEVLFVEELKWIGDMSKILSKWK